MTTQTEHNRPLRRRAESTRDRGPRRLEAAIDARRRLDTGRAEGTRTDPDPDGPSDRRYVYLTRAHD